MGPVTCPRPVLPLPRGSTDTTTHEMKLPDGDGVPGVFCGLLPSAGSPVRL